MLLVIEMQQNYLEDGLCYHVMALEKTSNYQSEGDSEWHYWTRKKVGIVYSLILFYKLEYSAIFP